MDNRICPRRLDNMPDEYIRKHPELYGCVGDACMWYCEKPSIKGFDASGKEVVEIYQICRIVADH